MHRRHKTALVVAAAAIMLPAGAVWCLPTSPAPAHRDSPTFHHVAPFHWHWDHGLHMEVHWDEVTADNVNLAVELSRETGMMSYTPLQEAITEGNVEGVKKCIALGADLEKRVQTSHTVLRPGTGFPFCGVEQYTPLQLAVVMKEYKMVELLLDAGADIEGRVRLDGSTPLMTAAFWNDADMVQLLIGRGANVSAVTGGEWCFEEAAKGRTALDIAREEGSAACVEMLSTGGDSTTLYKWESPIMGNLLPPLSIDDYTWHEYGNENVLSVTVSMTNYAVDEDLDIDTNPIGYTLSTSPAINGFHTVVTSNWYSRTHSLKPGESISFGLSFATTEPLPPRFDFRIISPYGISNPHAATKPAGKPLNPQHP